MSTRDTIALLAAGVLVAAMVNQQTQSPTSAHAAQSARVPRSVQPLINPDGTRPGLAPITSAADRHEGVRLISGLRVTRMGSKAGYRRTRYGDDWADTAKGVPYARNGCRTRDDLLARDGQDLTFRDGSNCTVTQMILKDPYSGRRIDWSRQNADEVQVDHVVPLSYGWRMGSRHWKMAKRVRFANDPLNLLPVYGHTNEEKGGWGPGGWLPPRHRVRCAYAVRFAQVAEKYSLPVTRADKDAMLAQCD